MTGIAIGWLIALAGGIVQIAAWIGALVNTNTLQDKTWFIVLLVGEILGVASASWGSPRCRLYRGRTRRDGIQQSRPSLPSDLRPSAAASLG